MGRQKTAQQCFSCKPPRPSQVRARLARRQGRKCAHCKTDISHLHAQRLRCDECQRLLRNSRLRDYRVAQPERMRGYDHKRRAKRNVSSKTRYAVDPVYRQTKRLRVNWRHVRTGTGTRKHSTLKAILKRDGHTCSFCGQRIREPYNGQLTHVDHIVPVAKGGNSRLANLQLLHARCNLRKRAS